MGVSGLDYIDTSHSNELWIVYTIWLFNIDIAMENHHF